VHGERRALLVPPPPGRHVGHASSWKGGFRQVMKLRGLASGKKMTTAVRLFAQHHPASAVVRLGQWWLCCPHPVSGWRPAQEDLYRALPRAGMETSARAGSPHTDGATMEPPTPAPEAPSERPSMRVATAAQPVRVLLMNWSPRAERMLAQLVNLCKAAHKPLDITVLVDAPNHVTPSGWSTAADGAWGRVRVRFVKGRPSRRKDLIAAGAAEADTLMIMRKEGGGRQGSPELESAAVSRQDAENLLSLAIVNDIVGTTPLRDPHGGAFVGDSPPRSWIGRAIRRDPDQEHKKLRMGEARTSSSKMKKRRRSAKSPGQTLPPKSSRSADDSLPLPSTGAPQGTGLVPCLEDEVDSKQLGPGRHLIAEFHDADALRAAWAALEGHGPGSVQESPSQGAHGPDHGTPWHACDLLVPEELESGAVAQITLEPQRTVIFNRLLSQRMDIELDDARNLLRLYGVEPTPSAKQDALRGLPHVTFQDVADELAADAEDRVLIGVRRDTPEGPRTILSPPVDEPIRWSDNLVFLKFEGAGEGKGGDSKM